MFQTFITNVDSADVRREEIDGVEYLVVPVVALIEKVLNCSNCLPGGEFVSFREIVRSLEGWNGRPVTVNHPQDESGNLVLARRDMALYRSVRAGEIWNATADFDMRSLRFEVFVDPERLKRTQDGAAILNKIEAGEMVEVSTGYTGDREYQPGAFNGRSYVASQRNLMPDHVALLPPGITGACSIEDGCGAPRFNNEDIKRPEVPAASNDSSTGEGGGSPDREPHKESAAMNREQMLRALVGLEGFALEQADLEKLNDESLKALAKANGIDCGCSGEGTSAPTANAEGGAGAAGSEGGSVGAEASQAGDGVSGEEEDQEDMVVLSAKEASFLRGLMGNADGLNAALAAGRRAQESEATEKASIVKRLVANTQCAISADLLKGMDIMALRGLEKSLTPSDYSGLSGMGQTGILNADDGRFNDPVPVFAAASSEGDDS